MCQKLTKLKQKENFGIASWLTGLMNEFLSYELHTAVNMVPKTLFPPVNKGNHGQIFCLKNTFFTKSN
jgi:hypothetical protein